MALRFLDSFDHYDTNTILQKWTWREVAAIQPIAAARRTGAQGLGRVGAGSEAIYLQLDAQGTWIVGFAKQVPGLSAQDFLRTMDDANEQGVLRLDAGGRLLLDRGDVNVASSGVQVIWAGVWYYIELKHIIADVGGLLEVRVDGRVVATFAGDTQATANPTANRIELRVWNVATYYDDLYILDGVDQSIADPNSPPNNDYLGDTQIQCLVPVGAGFHTELATLVGAPTHWQAEDEVPPDEDTSYVEDAVVDRRDTFAMTNLAVVSATIPGIQILTRARKTAAGVANFARMYRNAAADNQGIDTVLQESYAYHREIMGGDPIAAGAWTVPNINSMEMGFRTR